MTPEELTARECRELLAQGNVAEALRRLEAAYLLYPGEAEIRSLLAKSRSATAQAERKRWIDDALLRISRLMQLGQTESALTQAEEALRVCPDSAELSAALARIRERRGATARQTGRPSQPWTRLAMWTALGLLAGGAPLLLMILGGSHHVVPAANSGTITNSDSEKADKPTPPAATDGLSAMVGTAYSLSLEVPGKTARVSWALVGGSLPPGLSLKSDVGSIAGIPSKAGIYTFTVQGSDERGRKVEESLTVTVSDSSNSKSR